MTQTLAPSQESIASKPNRRILCCYTNVTPKLQIIRITNSPNLHLQRVVFSGERLIFESTQDADLEILSSETITHRIPCRELCVSDFYDE